MGEIGLAGELRRVRDLPQRLAEAARLGFRVAVVPAERSAEPRGPRATRTREIDGMKVLEVPDVASALRLLALTKERHGLRAVDE
jgi:DNA repair protein RadA/Sms